MARRRAGDATANGNRRGACDRAISMQNERNSMELSVPVRTYPTRVGTAATKDARWSPRSRDPWPKWAVKQWEASCWATQAVHELAMPNKQDGRKHATRRGAAERARTSPRCMTIRKEERLRGQMEVSQKQGEQRLRTDRTPSQVTRELGRPLRPRTGPGTKRGRQGGYCARCGGTCP